MKFTNCMKVNGELAMRFASEKARKLYNETDPLVVYEYETNVGKLYAYTGCLGNVEGLTFNQLVHDFEDIESQIE